MRSHPKQVGIRELKAHLSEYLRRGEPIDLTSRGKKIAELRFSSGTEDLSDEERWTRELEAKGLRVTRPRLSGTPRRRELAGLRRGMKGARPLLSEAAFQKLLEEEREERT